LSSVHFALQIAFFSILRVASVSQIRIALCDVTWVHPCQKKSGEQLSQPNNRIFRALLNRRSVAVQNRGRHWCEMCYSEDVLNCMGPSRSDGVVNVLPGAEGEENGNERWAAIEIDWCVKLESAAIACLCWSLFEMKYWRRKMEE